MHAVLFLVLSAAGVRVTVSKEETADAATGAEAECNSNRALTQPDDPHDLFSPDEIAHLEALPMPPGYIPDESHGRTMDGIELSYGIMPPTPEQMGADDVMEECSECDKYDDAQDCWGGCARECLVKWRARSGAWEKAYRYDCCAVTTCSVVNNLKKVVQPITTPIAAGVSEWDSMITGKPKPSPPVPMGRPVTDASGRPVHAEADAQEYLGAGAGLFGVANLIARPWQRVDEQDHEPERAPAQPEQRESFTAVYDDAWSNTEAAASNAVQAMQQYPALVTEDVVADTLAVKWTREVEERLVSQQTAVTFPGDKTRPVPKSRKALKLDVPRSYTGAIYGGKEAKRIRGLEWVKPLDLVMMETAARLEYGVSKGGYIDGEMLFKAGILLGKFQEKEFEGVKYQLPKVATKKAKGTKLSLTTVIVPSYDSFGEADLYALRKVAERLFTKLGRRLGQWQISRHFRSRQAWDEAAYQLYRVALRCAESQGNRDVAQEKLYAVPTKK